jgi:uncharacterized membrane protein YphA (DoxX/SURF4 family)
MTALNTLKPWHDPVGRWNRYWFAASNGLRLAICRIVVVAAQLLLFTPSLENQLERVRANDGFTEPQAIITAVCAIVGEENFRTVGVITAVYWLTVAVGVTTLIGLFTRASAFLFAAGTFLIVTHAYSYGEEHHPEALYSIFLMLLAFSPSGARLSVDAWIRRRRTDQPGGDGRRLRYPTALWPIKLTQVMFALIYMNAGMCKLHDGGLAWMNGYTLGHHLFADAVLHDLPVGIWLARFHGLCVVMSVGTIVLEVFFFVGLLLPRMLPVILLGCAGMHIGIYLTQNAPFFQFLVLYVIFIDFERRRRSNA